MRTWRVGTISMGATLLLLGVILLFSTVAGTDLHTIMMSWWPAILIILGVEVLVFLFFQGKESGIVKYDVFSIFFIAFLGTAGIGMAIVSSIGLSDHVSAAISSQERVFDLPEYEAVVENDVKRIVLETSRDSVTIESSVGRNVSVFGTYETQVAAGHEGFVQASEDYLVSHVKGDTLYLTLKKLPTNNGWQYSYSNMYATIVIPADKKLEVRGSGSEVILRPRSMAADWIIEDVGTAELYVETESNLAVTASNVYQLTSRSNQVDWEMTAHSNDEDDYETSKGQITLGDGSNLIQVLNSHEVKVNMVD